MRWLYFDPTNADEVAARNAIIQKIDAWWKEFERNTSRIDQLFRQKLSWDLPAWMNQHLETIAEGLMWEFGPAVNEDGHRLVITPEASHHLRPLAMDVVARAPKLPGWEFYSWRLPDGPEMLSDTINARVGCDFEDVSVALQAGDENRIDVLFRWPDLPDDEQTAMHAAIVAVETIFGEENLDKWVGVIEPLSAEQADQSGLKFLSSDRAAETFEALRMSMIEQLPEIPWAHDDENDKWALMQREAVQADDYAAQDDVITCVTCNPDVIATAFSSRVFTSERFGRNREIFAYVKIDGNDPGDMAYGDREEIEAAVRVALENERIGGLVGGSQGLRYVYIEFGTTNMTKAISCIRSALQKGKVPRRSWILFHDSILSAEWIGIYPDTPAPPERQMEDED